MKKLLLIALAVFAFTFQSMAQDLTRAFEAAYQKYPRLPKGLLEGMAYANTHIQNIVPEHPEDHHHGPARYGLFALIKDGEGYFKNNLEMVCKHAGVSEEAFLRDEKVQIMAVASYMNMLANKYKVEKLESFARPLKEFSELPEGNNISLYAQDLFVYEVLSSINRGISVDNKLQMQARPVDFVSAFGENNYKMLSAREVTIFYDSKKIQSGERTYRVEDIQATDYPPALWVSANTSNYSVGRSVAISAVTVHTVQGSYSSCISWFQNPSAKVSAHYVIRSSDGQVTQMVREADRAWHVGTENGYTVGIEHEGFINDASWYTQAMYQSSANLVKDICADRSIATTSCYNGPSGTGINVLSSSIRIKGHQHYPNQSHTDPGINWNWTTYYNLINSSGTPSDNTAPTTSVSTSATTYANDFTANFTDGDNVGVTDRFYQALEFTGTEWRGNRGNGFFNDNFGTTTINPEWTVSTGTWSTSATAGRLRQTNTTLTNTNINTALTQGSGQSYLYHFAGKLNSTTGARRFGIHIFTDNATATERNNSYLIWFSADDQTVRIIETVSNVLNNRASASFALTSGGWNDYKVTYNSTTGVIRVFINNTLRLTWTDTTPLTAGSAISLRTNEADVEFDDIKVYKSRSTSRVITVGPESNQDCRRQSPNSTTPACKVNSLVTDAAGNWSAVGNRDLVINWGTVRGEDLAAQGLSIYPNPTDGEISLSYQIKESGRVQIAAYDLQGKMVLNLLDEVQQAGSQQVTLQKMATLPAGMYLVRLQSNTESSVVKIVKK